MHQLEQPAEQAHLTDLLQMLKLRSSGLEEQESNAESAVAALGPWDASQESERGARIMTELLLAQSDRGRGESPSANATAPPHKPLHHGIEMFGARTAYFSLSRQVERYSAGVPPVRPRDLSQGNSASQSSGKGAASSVPGSASSSPVAQRRGSKPSSPTTSARRSLTGAPPKKKGSPRSAAAAATKAAAAARAEQLESLQGEVSLAAGLLEGTAVLGQQAETAVTEREMQEEVEERQEAATDSSQGDQAVEQSAGSEEPGQVAAEASAEQQPQQEEHEDKVEDVPIRLPEHPAPSSSTSPSQGGPLAVKPKDKRGRATARGSAAAPNAPFAPPKAVAAAAAAVSKPRTSSKSSNLAKLRRSAGAHPK